MADFYGSRDPRFRRAPNGRPIRRSRIAPLLVRPAAAAPKGAVTLFTRLLLGLVTVFFVLMLTGAGVTYGAYSQLADSLKVRLTSLDKHDSFETTRIYDRNGTLLYEFFGAGKRTRVPLEQISTTLISATISIE
ncbi:MAG TPA: hypothetical protein VFX76_02850, partial [Roseiflexaceae bacterium]|nr:hypothetical protein [Roseiflexaceae bacterium]